MKTTLLLLSLVAIALLSSAEAQGRGFNRYGDEMEDYCTPDNFYSFIEKAYTTSPHMPRYKDMPEWVKVCTKDIFNGVCDECEDDVNCIMTRGRDLSLTMPECHLTLTHQPRRLSGRRHPWNGQQSFDEQDDEAVGSKCIYIHYNGRYWCPDELDDEEDECSTRNFDRVLVATVEITGRAPNPACARAVFDKICDRCEDNIQCYLKLGRQVGPETRQCQPRRLRKGGAIR